MANNVVLSPETQTRVTVSKKRHGLAVIHPDDDLYHRESISATNGVVRVRRGKPFRVLIGKLGRTQRSLAKTHIIRTLLQHHKAIISTKMQFTNGVGLVNDAEDETPKSNISDVAEVEPSKKTEGVDVDELDLSHLPFCHLEKLRTMLQKISHTWNGFLREITTTEHRIDLVPGSRPVASVSYRSGPKAGQAEQDEVDRMQRAS